MDTQRHPLAYTNGLANMVTILFAPSRYTFLRNKMVAPLVCSWTEHSLHSSGMPSTAVYWYVMSMGRALEAQACLRLLLVSQDPSLLNAHRTVNLVAILSTAFYYHPEHWFVAGMQRLKIMVVTIERSFFYYLSSMTFLCLYIYVNLLKYSIKYFFLRLILLKGTFSREKWV
jgi:hypothetical protein